MSLKGLFWHFRFTVCDVFSNTYIRLYRGGFWKYRSMLLSRYGNKDLPMLYSAYLEHNCAYIGLGTYFASEPTLPHGLHGIHISNGANIGKNCTIMQNVTIGSNTFPDSSRKGAPIIGDNVFIGANATVIGNVVIGNNVRIGAGTCVYCNIPDNQTVIGGGIRVIPHKQKKDNSFTPINNM